jgi:hypothetical protein
MNWDVFFNIFSIILIPAFVAYLSYKEKKRKEEKDNEIKKAEIDRVKNENDLVDKIIDKMDSKIKVISERQQSIEIGIAQITDEVRTELTKITNAFEGHINDTNLKETIIVGIGKSTKGEIDRKLSNIPIQNLSIDNRAIIAKWGSMMLEFGLEYFNSDARSKDEIERMEILNEYKSQILSEYRSYVNMKDNSIKIDEKNNKLKLSDFIEKHGIYNSFELLLMSLQTNGLDAKEYLKTFRIQCNKFCTNMLIAIDLWNKMKNSIFEAA